MKNMKEKALKKLEEVDSSLSVHSRLAGNFRLRAQSHLARNPGLA